MNWLGGLADQFTYTIMSYAVFILLLNIVSFFLMGFDKLRAKKQGQRIPELTFMLLAACGGAVGILLAMILFKHKTSKSKFYIGVPILYGINKLMHLIVLAMFNK